MKRARKARRKHAAQVTTPAAGAAATQTVVVPVVPPRNPYVSLAHGRKAGAHGGGNRTRRQAEKRELRARQQEE